MNRKQLINVRLSFQFVFIFNEILDASAIFERSTESSRLDAHNKWLRELTLQVVAGVLLFFFSFFCYGIYDTILSFAVSLLRFDSIAFLRGAILTNVRRWTESVGLRFQICARVMYTIYTYSRVQIIIIMCAWHTQVRAAARLHKTTIKLFNATRHIFSLRFSSIFIITIGLLCFLAIYEVKYIIASLTGERIAYTYYRKCVICICRTVCDSF